LVRRRAGRRNSYARRLAGCRAAVAAGVARCRGQPVRRAAARAWPGRPPLQARAVVADRAADARERPWLPTRGGGPQRRRPPAAARVLGRGRDSRAAVVADAWRRE